jgi:formate transporter
MIKTIRESALAGLLISLAAAVYLRCGNEIVGAVLFSVGLIAVLLMKAYLFTGKIGYAKDLRGFCDCAIIFAVNAIVAVLFGWMFSLASGSGISAIQSRLDKPMWRIFVDSAGCGALIYIACEGWAATKNPLIPACCVMAFIVAGFEHCVADAFYLGASGLSWRGAGFVIMVAIGNSIGSLTVRWLQIGIEAIVPDGMPSDIIRRGE